MSDNHPSSLPPESSRLLANTLARIHRLRVDVEELERVHKDRDDLAGIRILLESLRAIAYETERKVIRHARALFDDRDNPASNISFRNRVGNLLLTLEQFLPEPIELASHPFGREIEALVIPFSDLAKSIAPGRELIFGPRDEYEFEDSLKERLVKSAENLSRPLKGSFEGLPALTVIAYPRWLDGDILLHTVIAHEIAHLALQRGTPNAVGPTQIGAAIDRHYDALQDEIREGYPKADDTELDQAERSVRGRIENWADELACDHLAAHMVGPAYLFALIDLEQATNRWAQRTGMPGYQTHPGLAWRIEKLLPLVKSFFEDGADSPAVQAGQKALQEVEEMVPDGAEDEITAVEREIIEEALALISKEETLQTALPEAADYLRTGSFSEEVDLVWSKLKKGIPPAERLLNRSTPLSSAGGLNGAWSRAMDWRSILNGSYLFWLAGEARSPEEDSHHRFMPLSGKAVEDWCEFNALVRGTVELAVIHQQTINASTRLEGINPP